MRFPAKAGGPVATRSFRQDAVATTSILGPGLRRGGV